VQTPRLIEPPHGVTQALRERILAGCHYGTLQPGDRLSSLRDVAAEFYTNPRAAMAAYRQLASEGLVRIRPRSGVFVPPPRREVARPPDVADWMVELLLRGLARGIPPADLVPQARACLDTVDVRVGCVECNRDQLYALCQQARCDYGFDAVAIDTAALAGGRRPLAIGSVDLLLTTRFHVEEVQRLGRQLRRPMLVATLDPAFITEVRRMHAAGLVWWVCTDPRFAAKLPRMFPGEPVRPVVLGRHPPDHIPDGDLVYATRRAADRLPRGWRGGRVVTITRVFSAETSRALLSFLVGKKLERAQGSSRRRARAAGAQQ
jgi:DNA-binding transcriptional regulator YhcF (GntR family)